ncbi:hypothetical protein Tco_0185137 [Tanacetum coccineum]
MSVNVEDGMVKNAASKLGCLVLKTLFTYLGTKVGGNMSRKQAWKEVVDKGVMLSPSEDRWSWDLNGSGEFSVASARSVVRAIFRRVCIWWDVSYMELDSFDEWISWITNLRLPSKHKRLLEGTPNVIGFVFGIAQMILYMIYKDLKKQMNPIQAICKQCAPEQRVVDVRSYLEMQEKHQVDLGALLGVQVKPRAKLEVIVEIQEDSVARDEVVDEKKEDVAKVSVELDGEKTIIPSIV